MNVGAAVKRIREPRPFGFMLEPQEGREHPHWIVNIALINSLDHLCFIKAKTPTCSIEIWFEDRRALRRKKK